SNSSQMLAGKTPDSYYRYKRICLNKSCQTFLLFCWFALSCLLARLVRLNCYVYNSMGFNGNGTSQDCGAMTHCVKYYVKDCADNSNKCTDVQTTTTGTIESCSVCSAELCNFDVVELCTLEEGDVQ
uniref:Protein quiver n=1 Tax=Macrostomum lignano TaxID=282301 RepID=A0A1I8FNP5_9PLAT